MPFIKIIIHEHHDYHTVIIMMLMVMMMLMIKRRSSDEERRLPRRRSLGGGETRSFSAPNFLQILLVSCKSCEFPSTLSSNQRRRDEVFSCSISKSPLSNSASKLMYMYVVVGFRSLRFNAKNGPNFVDP